MTAYRQQKACSVGVSTTPSRYTSIPRLSCAEASKSWDTSFPSCPHAISASIQLSMSGSGNNLIFCRDSWFNGFDLFPGTLFEELFQCHFVLVLIIFTCDNSNVHCLSRIDRLLHMEMPLDLRIMGHNLPDSRFCCLLLLNGRGMLRSRIH